ncbi:MAG: hypothetical protein ACMUIS_02200 [bacterium]
MKKGLIIAVIIMLLSSYAFMLCASNAVRDKMTDEVAAVNEIALSGGDVLLTIDSSALKGDCQKIRSKEACSLIWTTSQSNKKITIETDQPAPNAGLTASALNVQGGIPEPEVKVCAHPVDFITGISETTGGCDLIYVANVTSETSDGVDSHNITYTLTDL